MTQLRPLGLGEIIDRSVSLWRAHWRSLFLLALPFQLVGNIVTKLAMLLGRTTIPFARGGAAAVLSASSPAGLGPAAAYLGLLLAILCATLFIGQVSGVGLTHYLMPRATGRAGPTWSHGVTFALRRLPSATTGFLLSLGWASVVGLVVVLPGAGLLAGAVFAGPSQVVTMALAVLGSLASALGVVGLALWFLLRFVLMAQVLAAEHATGLGAFRRSGALSSGRVGPGVLGWVKGRLTILLTVMGALLLLVSLVSSAPLVALGTAFGASFELGHTVDDVVPELLLVPVQILQVAMGAVFSPLYEAFKVTFYADMRVRREGLDLELALS